MTRRRRKTTAAPTPTAAATSARVESLQRELRRLCDRAQFLAAAVIRASAEMDALSRRHAAHYPAFDKLSANAAADFPPCPTV